MTLNGLNALLEKKSFYAAHQKHVSEDRDPYSQRQNVNKWFYYADIFAVVPLEERQSNDMVVDEDIFWLVSLGGYFFGNFGAKDNIFYGDKQSVTGF